MSAGDSIPSVVLLVGADAASAASLQPTADLLEKFDIRTEVLLGTADAPVPRLPQGVVAIIVASVDAALPAKFAGREDVPVIRVPMTGGSLTGVDLLYDRRCNLPAGESQAVFATMAIGEAGAKNAALFVVSVLALRDERLRAAWTDYRARQTDAVLQQPPPGSGD